MEDQLAFAELSGDFNPVHVDREYARRTMFGDVLVHGVHALMWALNRYAAQHGSATTTVRAQFSKPVFVGELVTLMVRTEDAGVSLVLAADGVALLIANLLPSIRGAPPLPAPPPAEWSSEPRPLRHEEIAGREADLPFAVDRHTLSTMFPALTAAVGERAAGTLSLLSRVVGMECPGRQSLFSGLSFHVERDNPAQSIAYRVRRSSPAFAPVEIQFAGPDLSGTLSAFYRPPEVPQPLISELRGHVHPGEFSSQRALVIGGSRGLGELTAKILAAGGAKVAITYAVGAEDADRVKREIENHGGRCDVHRLDVLNPGESFREILAPPGITAAYYFATPKITSRRKSAFEPDKLRTFERYYVDAFRNFCEALAGSSDETVTVFYPSTVFIEEESRENVEYAMAKSAGEAVAADVTASGGVRVLSRRLPRMATDQTSGILKVDVEDSVAIMLGCVRAVHAAEGERHAGKEWR